MSPVTEEPSPLTFRKDDAVRRSAETCVQFTAIEEGCEPGEGEMERLIDAITEQLSAMSGSPGRAFEDPGAIPEPLDLSAVKATKLERILNTNGQESLYQADRTPM